MNYVKFEDEDHLYNIDDPTDLERAQWRMVDEDIAELPVWATPGSPEEVRDEGYDHSNDYRLHLKIFPYEPKDKGPRYTLKVYRNKKIEIQFDCWVLGEELEPVSPNDSFYHLAGIEDLHPKNSEYPNYYVEEGVLRVNGSLVVGDWVLEEVLKKPLHPPLRFSRRWPATRRGGCCEPRSSTRTRDMTKTFVSQKIVGGNAESIIISVRTIEMVDWSKEGALALSELYAPITDGRVGYWRDGNGKQVCGTPGALTALGGTLSGDLAGYVTHASKDEAVAAAKKYVKRSSLANKAQLLSELEKI